MWHAPGVPAPPPIAESDGPLVVDRDGAVATLWLNRPAKRNAVTYAMWAGLADACQHLAADPEVRLLVVRGAGEHFCAGADIGELATIDRADYHATNEAAERALGAFPKPTLAFVTGSCVGGGAEIALACDLRVADATARIGITPARLGIAYPPFAVERAVQVLGAPTAKLLLFTGDLVGAAEAHALGLVHEVHEPEAAEARLAELTTTLAVERSLLSQEAAKEMVDAVVEHGVVPAEVARRWDAEVAASDDPAEGAAAFAERRPPRFAWSGRAVT